MREKLLDLMKNEGLKPSQLAELLEINPAGISHILAGRNKPGFDMLQKILKRFPRINPDWLLLDSDKMYRDGSAMQSGQPSAVSPASQTAASGADLFGTVISGKLQDGEKSNDREPAPPHKDAASQISSALLTDKANVKRIIVLYDDQTFESFTPTMR